MIRSNVLWALLALMVVCFTAVAFGISKNSDTAHKAQAAAVRARSAAAAATRAECVLRSSYRAQTRQAEDFLAQHPHGAFGFTRSQIKQGIEQDRAQAAALKDVKCP